MANPEEDMLDLTKKKKKKKPVNLDELIGDENSSPAPEKPEDSAAKQEDDADDLDFSKKKKKKKKKTFALDEEAPSEKPATERRAEREIIDSAGESGDELLTVSAQDQENDGELDLSQLKKKKKKDVTFADDMEEEPADIHIDLGKSTWAGTDRDYTYDELLARVFDIMKKKNPEMVAGEKKRFIMKPPQCARVGTRKTSFINFTEICAVLHRQPKHCLSFILAELGTSGSVDGNNQLIIKGRFQQKQLESVLRRYIKEYVTCHTCRSPDTTLERKDRLYFLRCNVCQSRCSVASIKSGFQAVTGKRARMRAKAT